MNCLRRPWRSPNWVWQEPARAFGPFDIEDHAGLALKRLRQELHKALNERADATQALAYFDDLDRGRQVRGRHQVQHPMRALGVPVVVRARPEHPRRWFKRRRQKRQAQRAPLVAGLELGEQLKVPIEVAFVSEREARLVDLHGSSRSSAEALRNSALPVHPHAYTEPIRNGPPCAGRRSFAGRSAGFDFRLDAGSPAIDAATTLPDVTHDFGGCARPNGAAPEIGSWEF
jgi:hypothetical protein